MVMFGAFLATSGEVFAHQGHAHPAPWDACHEQVLDDACQWSDAKGAKYIGTCRSMQGALVCVRNQPIEQPSTSSVIPYGVAICGVAGILGLLLLFKKFRT